VQSRLFPKPCTIFRLYCIFIATGNLQGPYQSQSHCCLEPKNQYNLHCLQGWRDNSFLINLQGFFWALNKTPYLPIDAVFFWFCDLKKWGASYIRVRLVYDQIRKNIAFKVSERVVNFEIDVIMQKTISSKVNLTSFPNGVAYRKRHLVRL